MFTTFTVQPLLRGVHLDDNAGDSGTRPLLGRGSAATGGQPGSSSPGSRSTGIFTRNTRPMIEAMDNFGNNLYLGTSDGFLLHYIIDEKISSESDLPRSRLMSRKPLGFGKKVVERIMVLPHLRMAIVHCDSTLSFFKLPDFIPYSTQDLPHIKGVTAFCDDGSQKGRVGEDGSIRLCVTKRRIIQFYDICPGAISEAKELSLPNGALVVARWKNYICVADANDFKLIDSRIGRMIPVLPVVQSASSGNSAQVIKPVCVAIAENEFLLASATSSGQTAIGIFCSGSGDPVRGTLQWSSYPRALGVEFPYVAALLKSGNIEIHNILDQKLIQTVRSDPSMDLKTLVQGPGLAVWMSALARILTVQAGSISLNESGASSLQRKGEGNVNRISSVLARVLIAGKESVSALVTTPLILHADGLLRNGHVEEALVLSEKTTATLSSDNLHSERLQQELDYIYQKSGFIYLGETLFDDAFALLQRGKIDPRAVIALFPDVLQKPNILGDITVFVGVLELLKHLQSLPDIITRTMLKSGSDQGDEYKQMFLHNAKEVFQQYLVTFRKQHANLKGSPSPALVAVDTALLGLFAESSDRKQLYTLLESNNSCAKELSEQKLRESDRFYGLSLLYKSIKDYHKTLSIWKRLLTGEIVDDDFSIGLQEMATLLLSIHDAALVTEYGRWIVEQDEEIGLKIFMPGDSKKAAMFDSATLLAGFKKTLSPSGIMAYLEYLVFQRKSDNYDHRTSLCLLYVDILAAKLANTSVAEEYSLQVEGYRKHQEKALLNRGVSLPRGQEQSDLGTTFLSFLQRNASSDEIAKYRTKLVQLLQSSFKYDAAVILPKVIAIPQLQTEKAILLSCMGKQKAAIEVLVKDVRDYLGAEIFCLNAGTFQEAKKTTKVTSETPVDASTLEMKKSLFMMLLQEYLHIPQEHGGTVLSLRLLNSQSAYLELSEVIDLLPPYWTVELLQNYLLRSLRRSHHVFKEIQIMKGLSLGENLRTSEELFRLYEEQGPVVVTPQDVCSVCGASIADSVFMRTVDQKTIHLHCGSPAQAQARET
ncbi:transforming growth factor, beta receptor associated protein 1 [Podila minutissima]|nr:transforming growth factor, beta receptor associated protein 1 [Podila minutissima]